MATSGYSIPSLVTDLRRVVSEAADEREVLSKVRPLAQRAALSKDSWLEERFYKADLDQGFGVYLLHEEPDHRLAVFAVSWLPKRGAPPHDHGTWAVIAGVDGPEKNEFFERLDNRSRSGYAELKKSGEKIFNAGDALAKLVAYLFQDRGTAAVFDHVVQEGGDGLILVPACFEDEGGNAQHVGYVRNIAGLAGLAAVLLRGIDEGVFEAGA